MFITTHQILMFNLIKFFYKIQYHTDDEIECLVRVEKDQGHQECRL